ncbi:hypothetical protein [Akkermansia sp. 54_46]|uniref:hypothetical protein n=1 Tax=Akkermansia sp. 54_46 TaxID=1896967 RepID=UPI00095A38BC|nr:hypothetical protein [Akkermansia sp. 54_46]OLA88851.1 MAG: hypothetical protein BHW66_08310 [Akkermansia sp. 54_46]
MSKKRFIYHGYLQIAELDAAATESAMPVLRKTYLWDPLEPAATRILAMGLFDETGTCAEDLYYTHDLLKNTTALFDIRVRSGSPANTLMTNWGWFTTITVIIIPKMAGGLVGILL